MEQPPPLGCTHTPQRRRSDRGQGSALVGSTKGEKEPDVLPQGKGWGAGRVRVKAGARPLALVGLPPLPALGTKGHGGQAAHGPGSGRAGGGRSRLPLGSRHRPSTAARPPALEVLRPHRSWTARAVSVGGDIGKRGKGGLSGSCGPHARPEVQPKTLDPRSWIARSHSWPWVLTSARAVEAREALDSWGRGDGQEKKEG